AHAARPVPAAANFHQPAASVRGRPAHIRYAPHAAHQPVPSMPLPVATRSRRRAGPHTPPEPAPGPAIQTSNHETLAPPTDQRRAAALRAASTHPLAHNPI